MARRKTAWRETRFIGQSGYSLTPHVKNTARDVQKRRRSHAQTKARRLPSRRKSEKPPQSPKYKAGFSGKNDETTSEAGGTTPIRGNPHNNHRQNLRQTPFAPLQGGNRRSAGQQTGRRKTRDSSQHYNRTQRRSRCPCQILSGSHPKASTT